MRLKSSLHWGINTCTLRDENITRRWYFKHVIFLPSGCQASEGVWTFQNTNQARSKLSHFHVHFIKIHYVVTSHKWNTWDPLHLYVYFLKRNIRDTRTYPATIYRPRHRNIKDLFVEREPSRAVFILAAAPGAGNCISPSSCAPLQGARCASIIVAIPLKPSRSDLATSR